MKNFIYIIILTIFFTVAACSFWKSPHTTTIITVNGITISQENFQFYAMRVLDRSSLTLHLPSEITEFKQRIMSDLINDTILLSEGMRMGITCTDHELFPYLSALFGNKITSKSDINRYIPKGIDIEKWLSLQRQRYIVFKLIAHQKNNLPTNDDYEAWIKNLHSNASVTIYHDHLADMNIRNTQGIHTH